MLSPRTASHISGKSVAISILIFISLSLIDFEKSFERAYVDFTLVYVCFNKNFGNCGEHKLCARGSFKGINVRPAVLINFINLSVKLAAVGVNDRKTDNVLDKPYILRKLNVITIEIKNLAY